MPQPPAATVSDPEAQRRISIGFINWAHALAHFVMLIFPTVVIDQTEHRRLDDARLEAERRSERSQREASVAPRMSRFFVRRM